MGVTNLVPPFYVGVTSYEGVSRDVTEDDRNAWRPLWDKANTAFQDLLDLKDSLRPFRDKMFFIWDGNHRHMAWTRCVQREHPDEPS